MDSVRIEQARHRYRLSALVRPLVKLKRASGGFIGCCPFHKDRHPSFHVSDERGTFKCFGCGAWGDVFDFVMMTRGSSFMEAVDFLGGAENLVAGGEIGQRASLGVESEGRRIRHAHALWLKRLPLEGTLAETYLRKTRRIAGRVPTILGFVEEVWCPPIEAAVPALIAPLQDSNGHVTAVQQIFLNEATGDAWRDETGHRIKRTLGVMRDGAVRLGVPGRTLGLSGSVEDGLSASALFSLPVWAVCGEARLARAWLPPEVENVLIFADADEAGLKFAAAARDRFAPKRRTEIVVPERAKDFNEELGHDEHRARAMAESSSRPPAR